MSFGGIALALTAVQAVSQIGQGYTAKAEADYNASLLEGKAEMIDVQKGIQNARDLRASGRAMSTGFANMAAMGVGASGSPLAVMTDMKKQMEIDRILGQINMEQEKQYTLNEASNERRRGKYARNSAFSNAFTTILSGVSNYGTSSKQTSLDYSGKNSIDRGTWTQFGRKS